MPLRRCCAAFAESVERLHGPDLIGRHVTKSLVDVRCRINAFILPKFGTTEASVLSARVIRDWHREVAATPPRARTRSGEPQRYRQTANDPDKERKRQVSANKVLTILKAALNHAWHEGHIPSDDSWRRVKPFRDVDTARVRYLSNAECVRLVNACDPNFRYLVQAALLTGCRYGELTALRCGDFDAEAGTVHIRTSKSGKPRFVPLNDEGIEFFTGVTTGRPTDEITFLRADGKPWRPSQQRRRLNDAAARARVEDVNFHILRHTYGSALAMRGVPMGVIAHALGHADTRITEKHYAALAPSYIAEMIRTNLPRLGLVKPSDVISLSGKR